MRLTVNLDDELYAVTQDTLLRVHMQLAADRSAAAAWRTLGRVVRHPAHTFWPGGLSFVDAPHAHLRGAKQVTDAWLAELARQHSARLATLDAALALLHPDVADLIPA